MGEWRPLAPKLVAEVQYDYFTGGRFRHGRKLPSPEAGQEACGMCDCPSSFSRTSLLTNEASGLTYWHLLLPKYGQARDPFPRLTDPESSRRRPTS